ncbi:MAG: hypothetical protein QOJ07_2174 [Thermoleophilaceae bacterium]|jgi:hypothetical protein|nr:hypothetical protein [Thermoleophilaceae bacterium]
MIEGQLMCMIVWHANPFRGDKFEDAWRAPAETALRFGASEWNFLRSLDDPLDFIQTAIMPDKTHWERYWYSEEISEARADASGLYQVPVLPVYFRVTGAGELVPGAAGEAA